MPKKIDRSPPVAPATPDEFFDAIDLGNAAAAADALRRMDGLGPGDLQLLADLFSDGGSKFYRHRLVLTRNVGRPADPMKKGADDSNLARMVADEHRKSGLKKVAVSVVGERINRSRSTVYRRTRNNAFRG